MVFGRDVLGRSARGDRGLFLLMDSIPLLFFIVTFCARLGLAKSLVLFPNPQHYEQVNHEEHKQIKISQIACQQVN